MKWKKPAAEKWQLGEWTVRKKMSPYSGRDWWVAEHNGEAKYHSGLLRNAKEFVEGQVRMAKE